MIWQNKRGRKKKTVLSGAFEDTKEHHHSLSQCLLFIPFLLVGISFA